MYLDVKVVPCGDLVFVLLPFEGSDLLDHHRLATVLEDELTVVPLPPFFLKLLPTDVACLEGKPLVAGLDLDKGPAPTLALYDLEPVVERVDEVIFSGTCVPRVDAYGKKVAFSCGRIYVMEGLDLTAEWDVIDIYPNHKPFLTEKGPKALPDRPVLEDGVWMSESLTSLAGALSGSEVVGRSGISWEARQGALSWSYLDAEVYLFRHKAYVVELDRWFDVPPNPVLAYWWNDALYVVYRDDSLKVEKVY